MYMEKLIKYLISIKTSASIVVFATIVAVLYYNNSIMQNYIAENIIIQSLIFFLTIISLAGIFFSTTLRKELNDKDVVDIIKKEQTSTKEILKQIKRSKIHHDRARGISRRV